eukprot:25703-Prorocentrum_lima.AAC.1
MSPSLGSLGGVSRPFPPPSQPHARGRKGLAACPYRRKDQEGRRGDDISGKGEEEGHGIGRE